MGDTTIRRTVRTSVLSILLTLVAVLFLAMGVSAHAGSQARHSQTSSKTNSQTSIPSQAGSRCPANTVHIKFMPCPPNFLEQVFTCNTMTVKAGTPVIFVDDSSLETFIVKPNMPGIPRIIVEVQPGSTASLPTRLPGQLQLAIYGTPHPEALLTLSVV